MQEQVNSSKAKRFAMAGGLVLQCVVIALFAALLIPGLAHADMRGSDNGADGSEQGLIGLRQVPTNSPMSEQAIEAEGSYGMINWYLHDDGTLAIEPIHFTIVAGTPHSTVSIPTEFWSQEIADSYNAKVKAVTIAEGVDKIGSWAFKGASYVQTVSLPTSLELIDWNAFEGCTSLTAVTIPINVGAIENNAFSGCTSLKSLIMEGGTSIAQMAFKDCSTLENVYLSETLTEIDNNAFQGCTSLTSIEIPDSVKKVKSKAFSHCNNLTSAYFYCSQVELGESIFIRNILDPDVTIYGYDDTPVQAYAKANGHTFSSLGPSGKMGKNGDLNWVLADDGTLTISGNGDMVAPGFGIARWVGQPNYEYKKVKKVIIGEGVTGICDYAFSNCSNLKSVDIPTTVTSVGECAFENCTSLPAVCIPSCFDWTDASTYETGVYTWMSIADDAFSGCTGLSTVGIGIGVSSSSEAFSGCTGLKNAYIQNLRPDGFSAGTFANAELHYMAKLGDNLVGDFTRQVPTSDAAYKLVVSGTGTLENNWSQFEEQQSGSWVMPAPIANLKSLVVSAGVERLGGSAFSEFSKLESVVVPGSVKSIGDYCFWKCANLKQVDLQAGLQRLDCGAFEGCSSLKAVVLPSGMTTIGDAAFADCSGLQSIGIPDSVTTIGEKAFYSCESLASVKIPRDVKEIAQECFSGCSSLSSIDLPSGLLAIGPSAFDSCSGLKSVSLPTSLTRIEELAFGHCKGLTNVSIPNGMSTLGALAFSDCTSLESVTLPESMTSIGEGAFSECASLRSVAFPSKMKLVGAGAFSDCSKLATVQFSDSIEVIDASAFSSCASLKTVTIPRGVRAIGSNAFSDCTNLERIVIPATVTSMGAINNEDNLDDELLASSPIFENCNKLVIHGYAGSGAQRYARQYDIPFVALDSTGEDAGEQESSGDDIGGGEGDDDNGSGEGEQESGKAGGKGGSASGGNGSNSGGAASVKSDLATYAGAAKAAGFTDLVASEWYMRVGKGLGSFDNSNTLYLDYTVGRKLMTGTDSTHFDPNGRVSRAMVAMVLFRLGNPGAENGADANETGLRDVAGGQWYTRAVNWCFKNGVVTGYKDAAGNPYEFRPDAPVSREEMALMYARYCWAKGGMQPVGTADAESFPDYGDISGWAREGVAFCKAKGVISGKSDTGRFDPHGNSQRCEMAKVVAAVARMLG